MQSGMLDLPTLPGGLVVATRSTRCSLLVFADQQGRLVNKRVTIAHASMTASPPTESSVGAATASLTVDVDMRHSDTELRQLRQGYGDVICAG